MRLRSIDLETTGMEPPEAEVIEIGWTDVDLTHDGPILFGERDAGSTLFGCTKPCPPEVIAVHHLTARDLAGREVCTPDALRSAVAGADVVVAHNAEFEGRWFTPDILGGAPLVCTLKAASRVWPDAPGHSNQVLRYWLGLDLPERLAMPPHRAQPDSYVTAQILIRLLGRATIDQMIAWSAEPRVMPRITFGKHRGSKWADAPRDYLEWVLRSDLDADTKWNARRELDRRAV